MSTPQTPEVVGNNATFWYSPDQVTWTQIGKIVNIQSFKVTSPEVKITTLGDTAQKSQPGTPDYGELMVESTYAKSLVCTLLGFQQNKTIQYWKMTVDDSATVDSVSIVQGWVKEYDPFGDIKEDEKINSKITIKVTDVIVFTVGC
jgi:hypothetical protein